MAATFSTHTRGYSANAFVDSLRIADLDNWETGKFYTEGILAFYGTRKYISSSAGTSGISPPTHTIGAASDGGVNWIFVETLNVDNNYKNNLYLFYGKKTDWLNDVPSLPSVTNLDEYEISKNIIAYKKITANETKVAARRYNWESGTVYTPYDSKKDLLSFVDYPTPFYVLNSNYEIYKCLNNNGGVQSTSEPVGSSLNHIRTPDGYVWFYMGTLTPANSLLMSNEYIPLESKPYDDGSDQWLVQQNAKKKSISSWEIIRQNSFFPATMIVNVFGDGTGATATAYKNNSNVLTQVLPNNIGTGYTRENTYAIVSSTGEPGGGALATVNVLFNSIGGYTIINGGANYTTATAVINNVGGEGQDALANVILGTVGGPNEGKVVGLTIVNPGSGYINGATVTISGNGTGATAVLSVNSTGIIGSVSVVPGSAGLAYSSANVVIDGDGTGATATVSSIGTAGEILNINLTNAGSGYSYANAYIIPGPSGALCKPIMAPQSGHGSNIVAELGTNTAIISVKVDSVADLPYFESDILGFRQVGLAANLIDLATDEAALENMYIGPAHSQYNITLSSLNKVSPNTGYIMYLNNIKKTTRSEDQEENIKIAISF